MFSFLLTSGFFASTESEKGHIFFASMSFIFASCFGFGSKQKITQVFNSNFPVVLPSKNNKVFTSCFAVILLSEKIPNFVLPLSFFLHVLVSLALVSLSFTLDFNVSFRCEISKIKTTELQEKKISSHFALFCFEAKINGAPY